MKLELTPEEMVIITKAFKSARIPMKTLEMAHDTFWHEDDVVEVFWRFGLAGCSFCSNGDAMVNPNNGDEKEVKRSTLKRVLKMASDGMNWKSIDGYMVGCKEESDR